MLLSDNPKENLIILAFCIGVLAIAAIVNLIHKCKVIKNMVEYYRKKQGNDENHIS